MSLREILKKLGWQQGALLELGADDRLTEHMHYEDVPEDARFLVLTQTCDLIQDIPKREPFFEVLCLRPLNGEPDGNYADGKNSRRIEFKANEGGLPREYWYAHPFERHLVDRMMLLDHEPSGFIDTSDDLAMILKWVVRRYNRTAFPDEFERQIGAKKVRKAIRNSVVALNPFVSDVLVHLEPFRDLEDGEGYTLRIMLLMRQEQFDDPDQYDQCAELKAQLEEALNKPDRVEVDEITIESPATVTLEDVAGFKSWDFSYLSYRDPEAAAEPLEPLEAN